MSDRPSKLRRGLVLVALVAVAAAAASALRLGTPPVVELTTEYPALGPANRVEARFASGPRGLAELRLELVQDGRTVALASASHTPRPSWRPWGRSVREDRLTADAGWQAVDGLSEGEAVLRAVAERPGTWLRRAAPVVVERRLEVRLRPPTVVVRSRGHYPRQGGADLVVYELEPSAVRDGVAVGELWFGGHDAPPGADGVRRRFALYAVPFDHEGADTIRLVAEDDAGNRAAVGFVDRLRPRPPASDRLQLSDEFLDRVVPPIMRASGLEDQGGLLANYLRINGWLRRENARTLDELSAASPPERLWSQPFLPMPNAQVMSAFADRRTYLYEGREVDRQVHLGYDLASIRQAPVPAANDGVVALARYFGIYGNAVVVDHGLGLLSLYGHLSSIAVGEGERVERGQLLGRTGETGLAGGDHLHFTLLLGGQAVDPLEWWDADWIRNRVDGRLDAAG